MATGSVFDRIVIAVPELASACEQYRELLGGVPYRTATADGEPAAWWALPNTVLELLERPVDDARIQGLVLTSGTAGASDQVVRNSLGVDIAVCDGVRTAEYRAQLGAKDRSQLSVDHVVLRTDDAQACIALFEGDLAIRLALDKTVPEWGGRMLFFRAGKLTLEVIQSQADGAQGSFFWGIALQCRQLEPCVTDLVARGVSLSELREGRKPGTRVATVKSHCLGIPTLLIEPAR